MIRNFPLFSIIKASMIIFLVLKIPCSRLLKAVRLLDSVDCRVSTKRVWRLLLNHIKRGGGANALVEWESRKQLSSVDLCDLCRNTENPSLERCLQPHKKSSVSS